MSVTAPAPSTGPAGGSGTSPPAPRENCPLCGAPLDAEQGWCLNCGAAARTRLAASSNWKAPLIVLAVVALVALGVLAAALVKLAGPSESSGPAVTSTVYRAPTATAAPPTTAAPATPTGAAPTTPPAASGPTGPTSGPTGSAKPPAATSPTGKTGLSTGARTQLRALETAERSNASPAAKQRLRERIKRVLEGK